MYSSTWGNSAIEDPSSLTSRWQWFYKYVLRTCVPKARETKRDMKSALKELATLQGQMGRNKDCTQIRWTLHCKRHGILKDLCSAHCVSGRVLCKCVQTAENCMDISNFTNQTSVSKFSTRFILWSWAQRILRAISTNSPKLAFKNIMKVILKYWAAK